MARVKTGPFFILFFALLGWSSSLLAKETITSPHAVVSTDSDHLYLWLNQNQIKSTGAWMAFFDFGIGTGANTGEGGLDRVDLRYEQKHLFRHTPGFEKTWTPVDSPIPLKWKNWQVVRIPIPHLVPDSAQLQWRVVLFPHHQDKPLFLPAKGVGIVPPNRQLVSPSSGLNAFHLFHSLVRGLEHQKLFGLAFQPPLLPEAKFSPLELQSLWPDEVVLPLVGNNIFLAEKRLDEAFHHLQKSPYPLILDSRDSDLPPLGTLMAAAQMACAFNQQPFAPIIRHPGDLPPNSSPLLISWEGDLKNRVKNLEFIRKQRPNSTLFIPIGLDFLNSNDQEISFRAWHRFKAKPLISRGVDLHQIHPKRWLPCLWQNFLLHTGGDWRAMPNYLPTPSGMVAKSPKKRIDAQWKGWMERFGSTTK